MSEVTQPVSSHKLADEYVLFDKKQVALKLRCSVSKIEKMMAAKEITYLKLGSLVRFRPSDLEPFFAGTPASPGAISAHTSSSALIENTGTYESVAGSRGPSTLRDVLSSVLRISGLQDWCSGDYWGCLAAEASL